jgi:hypothetical protein
LHRLVLFWLRDYITTSFKYRSYRTEKGWWRKRFWCILKHHPNIHLGGIEDILNQVLLVIIIVMWHEHPLLGKELANTFPYRSVLGIELVTGQISMDTSDQQTFPGGTDTLYNRPFRSEWSQSRVGVGSNTSTVALQVVGADKKGTHCLGLIPGHPVPGGYKYGNLALQVGGVSKLWH